jgi:hypothetical protein
LPCSLAAAAGSGAIGAACEVPETEAKIKPATAIAKKVRVILVLLGGTLSAEFITREKNGGSTSPK